MMAYAPIIQVTATNPAGDSEKRVTTAAIIRTYAGRVKKTTVKRFNNCCSGR